MWSSSVLLLFFIGLSANVLSLSIATSEVFRDTRDNSDTNGTTTNVPTTTEEADERKPIQEPEISTNFKIDFVNENGTEIVGPRRTIFEVIPVDYICDFCLNVIDKLKIRQNVEKDFEANIKEECWKYNETIHDDGTICELVNRANLDRLQNDKTSLICIDEHFCDDTRKEDADKKAREERIKTEDERREAEKKQDEWKEELEKRRLKLEDLKENIKNEGARIELKKRLEKLNKDKQNHTKAKGATGGGEAEFSVDEKESSGHHDYLDEKEPEFAAAQQPTQEEKDKSATQDSVAESSIQDHQPASVSKVATGGEKEKISGNAQIRPIRVLLDRTVKLSLDVEDIAK